MPSETMPDAKVVAVVLAAGYSRRFGAADKRCARLADGRGLLAASVVRAGEAFPLLRVVLREDDDPIALGLPGTTPVIFAPRAQRGLGASLGDAIAALGRDDALANVEVAAILLGDMPDLRLGTLHALQRLATRSRIVRPCYVGRPGHPVLFGRDFWPELEALDGDEGARDVIRHHRDRYHEIAVEDSGVCRDIDTPADLTRP